MKLVKITNNYAVFKDGKRVVAKPLNPIAAKVLNWHARHVAANND